MKNEKLKTFKIQCKETGALMETGLSLQSAEKQVASHEEEDKADDTYTLDFYEIVEEIK